MDVTDIATPQSKRFRLHLSTWVILLLAAIALFLIIVPGECLEFRSEEVFALREGLTIEHGWPWTYLRWKTYPPKAQTPSPPNDWPNHGIPWLQKVAWTFRGDSVWNHRISRHFNRDTPGWWPLALVLDLVTASAILVLLTLAIEYRRRHRRLYQFSLAEIFGLMLLLGCSLGWWMSNLRAYEAEQHAMKQLNLYHWLDYRGPLWLRRLVGTDLLKPFYRVAGVDIEKQPAEFPRVVKAFPYLHELEIHAATIDDNGLAPVAKLTELRWLALYTPLVTDEGLAHIAPLVKLRRLYLGVGPTVTSEGMRHLTKLNDLKRLSVGGTAVDNSGLPYIGQLSSLEYLALNYTSVDSAGLDELSKLQNLRVLHLSGTQVDNQGLRELATMSRLRELGLVGTKVDGTGLADLAGLTSLIYLYLNGTSIGDEHLKHLEDLHNLAELHVQATRVTQAGVNLLQQHLPHCNIIWR